VRVARRASGERCRSGGSRGLEFVGEMIAEIRQDLAFVGLQVGAAEPEESTRTGRQL